MEEEDDFPTASRNRGSQDGNEADSTYQVALSLALMSSRNMNTATGNGSDCVAASATMNSNKLSSSNDFRTQHVDMAESRTDEQPSEKRAMVCNENKGSACSDSGGLPFKKRRKVYEGGPEDSDGQECHAQLPPSQVPEENNDLYRLSQQLQQLQHQQTQNQQQHYRNLHSNSHNQWQNFNRQLQQPQNGPLNADPNDIMSQLLIQQLIQQMPQEQILSLLGMASNETPHNISAQSNIGPVEAQNHQIHTVAPMGNKNSKASADAEEEPQLNERKKKQNPSEDKKAAKKGTFKAPQHPTSNISVGNPVHDINLRNLTSFGPSENGGISPHFALSHVTPEVTSQITGQTLMNPQIIGSFNNSSLPVGDSILKGYFSRVDSCGSNSNRGQLKGNLQVSQGGDRHQLEKRKGVEITRDDENANNDMVSCNLSYVDRSSMKDPLPRQPLTAPNRTAAFVVRLFIILTIRKDLCDIIRWSEHGRSFILINPVQFELEVLTVYFGSSVSLGSFFRKVERFGFKRIADDGSSNATYYHEYFLRGKPWLCKLISKVDKPQKYSSKNRFTEEDNPVTEQFLKEMSRLNPLPSNDEKESIGSFYYSVLTSIDSFVRENGPKARILVGMCTIDNSSTGEDIVPSISRSSKRQMSSDSFAPDKSFAEMSSEANARKGSKKPFLLTHAQSMEARPSTVTLSTAATTSMDVDNISVLTENNSSTSVPSLSRHPSLSRALSRQVLNQAKERRRDSNSSAANDNFAKPIPMSGTSCGLLHDLDKKFFGSASSSAGTGNIGKGKDTVGFVGKKDSMKDVASGPGQEKAKLTTRVNSTTKLDVLAMKKSNSAGEKSKHGLRTSKSTSSLSVLGRTKSSKHPNDNGLNHEDLMTPLLKDFLKSQSDAALLNEAPQKKKPQPIFQAASDPSSSMQKESNVEVRGRQQSLSLTTPLMETLRCSQKDIQVADQNQSNGKMDLNLCRSSSTKSSHASSKSLRTQISESKRKHSSITNTTRRTPVPNSKQSFPQSQRKSFVHHLLEQHGKPSQSQTNGHVGRENGSVFAAGTRTPKLPSMESTDPRTLNQSVLQLNTGTPQQQQQQPQHQSTLHSLLADFNSTTPTLTNHYLQQQSSQMQGHNSSIQQNILNLISANLGRNSGAENLTHTQLPVSQNFVQSNSLDSACSPGLPPNIFDLLSAMQGNHNLGNRQGDDNSSSL